MELMLYLLMALITCDSKVVMTAKEKGQFVNVEYFDVHFMYGFCDGNSRIALKDTSTDIQIRGNPSDICLQCYTAV
jgi:hypothetical protein